MGRKADSKRARIAFEIIKKNPGIHIRALPYAMGIQDTRNIENILTSCESAGLLISEDDTGHLQAWKIEDSE